MHDRTLPLEAEIALVRQRLGKTERRQHPRYRCSLATTGRLYLPVTGDSLTVWVGNLSVGGIGLGVSQPLEVGTDVIVTLKVTNQRALHRIPARVAHVTEEADGSWRVGCAFVEPLSPELMENLL